VDAAACAGGVHGGVSADVLCAGVHSAELGCRGVGGVGGWDHCGAGVAGDWTAAHVRGGADAGGGGDGGGVVSRDARAVPGAVADGGGNRGVPGGDDVDPADAVGGGGAACRAGGVRKGNVPQRHGDTEKRS